MLWSICGFGIAAFGFLPVGPSDFSPLSFQKKLFVLAVGGPIMWISLIVYYLNVLLIKIFNNLK